MKRFPLSTLHNHISAPRSNFDMVDTDSESSHRALFVETNAASDLPERTLHRVVTLLGGGRPAIAHACRRQHCITMSSCEAELV